MLVLTARWVCSVNAPPQEHGTVTVRGKLITAVEPRGARAADIDLGNAAIIPGLVNAHTHLDLSGLRGLTPPGPDFTGWLKTIIAHRRQRSAEQTSADVRAGLAESHRFGATLLGDISAAGSAWPDLCEAPCWSVVFHEMLALHHQRVMPVWQAAVRWLDEHADTATCRSGLSPHASYSVHQSLFRAAGLAGAPLAIHLGETQAECDLLAEHRGPFVDFLSELGVWDEDGLAPSLDWIVWRGERAPALLLVHGNYLRHTTPLPPHATIVYCPRTHAAFGHPPHPFRDFLARGVRVALGTDSLASNPDLDILAEARFIRERHPDFSGEQLLRMATLAGAEALGFGRATGSLAPGKSADLVVVPLPDDESADPYALLFEPGSTADATRRTMWRGQWR
jgi:cytosine/adenosine deaminase-related metal-dependent hydrolase